MQKKKYCYFWILSGLLSSTIGHAVEENYTLEQVVVLSRHGLRAPLIDNSELLAKTSPLPLPTWSTPPGILTEKGEVLETYQGKFFREWLGIHGLFNKQKCPDNQDIYVYADNMQRTIATAQFFTQGAFAGCTIAVNHLPQPNTPDPLYAQLISDISPDFKQKIEQSINQTAGKQGIIGLIKASLFSFNLLEQMIEFRDAQMCKAEKTCQLAAIPTHLFLEKKQPPILTGPLLIGMAYTDMFVLQNYEGFPTTEVAWGKIKSATEWQTLLDIKSNYIRILFGSPVVAKAISSELMNKIATHLKQRPSAKTPKLSIYVGHDVNIASILGLLGVGNFHLPQQYEQIPIGGKLIFQRWHDTSTDKNFVRLAYFYQSTEQIRNLEPLSLTNPVQQVTLNIPNCRTNQDGLCPLEDFEQIVSHALAD